MILPRSRNVSPRNGTRRAHQRVDIHRPIRPYKSHREEIWRPKIEVTTQTTLGELLDRDKFARFHLLACFVRQQGQAVESPVKIGKNSQVVAIIVDDTEFRAYRREYDSRKLG